MAVHGWCTDASHWPPMSEGCSRSPCPVIRCQQSASAYFIQVLLSPLLALWIECHTLIMTYVFHIWWLSSNACEMIQWSHLNSWMSLCTVQQKLHSWARSLVVLPQLQLTHLRLATQVKIQCKHRLTSAGSQTIFVLELQTCCLQWAQNRLKVFAMQYEY